MTRRGALLAAAVLAALAPATPAEESPSPAFPTQSLGDRGLDVVAIQLLLARHGVAAPPLGLFDEATLAAVAAFQAARGLAPTGVVDDATWSALVVPLGPGAVGPAVVALHKQLAGKHGLTGPDGAVFTTNTTEAVRWFQAHAGLPATGLVDAPTWRHLAAHFVYPDFGLPGWCVYYDLHDEWGTAALVAHLEAAATLFAERGLGRVAVGDVSLEHGGELQNHSSHRVGLDVDLRLVRTDRAQCDAGCTIDQTCYDRAGTLALIDAILDAAEGHVRRIYFEDEALYGYRGVVRYAEGHRDHLHVRYCEATHALDDYAGCGGESPSPVPLVASGTQTRWTPWRERFEHNLPWAFEEEIVSGNAACYGAGLARVEIRADAARNGTRGLAVVANDAAGASSNHVIAMKRLADAPLVGRHRYEANVRLDPSGAAQAGPEMSVQSTALVAPRVYLTSTAGIQHLPAIGAWQVWAETSPQRAEWVPVAVAPLVAGAWYNVSVEFDHGTHRYERMRIVGNGSTVTVPLASHAIAREAKGWDREGVWASLEAENAWTDCGLRPPTTARVDYDDVAILRLSS